MGLCHKIFFIFCYLRFFSSDYKTSLKQEVVELFEGTPFRIIEFAIFFKRLLLYANTVSIVSVLCCVRMTISL